MERYELGRFRQYPKAASLFQPGHLFFHHFTLTMNPLRSDQFPFLCDLKIQSIDR